MKTIKEWIDTLPQDIKEMAYKYTENFSSTLLHSTLCFAISCSFDWSETAEGHEFWSLVSIGKFDEARALLIKKKETMKTLSQSAVKTWEAITSTTPAGLNFYDTPKCKHYFKLIYVDGHETPPSDAQLLGQVFEYKLTGQTTLHGVTPELPKLKNGGTSADERMLDERVGAVRAVFEHHKIVVKETGSTLQANGMTGHLDAVVEVNGQRAIMDIKFTQTKEDDKWFGWGDLDKLDLLQPATYVELGMHTWGKYLPFYYLVVGKNWMRLIKIVLTIDDINEKKHRFNAVRDALEGETFEPSASWANCKGCKLAQVCQHAVKMPEIEVYQRNA